MRLYIVFQNFTLVNRKACRSEFSHDKRGVGVFNLSTFHFSSGWEHDHTVGNAFFDLSHQTLRHFHRLEAFFDICIIADDPAQHAIGTDVGLFRKRNSLQITQAAKNPFFFGNKLGWIQTLLQNIQRNCAVANINDQYIFGIDSDFFCNNNCQFRQICLVQENALDF